MSAPDYEPISAPLVVPPSEEHRPVSRLRRAVDAVRNRVPMAVLLLMGWNLVFDAILGLIPGVGDVADAAHRANVKNLRLLEQTVAAGRRVDTSSKGYVIRASLLVAAILAVVIAFAVAAIWVLLKLLRVV